jgi:hypothetical protein
MEVLMVKVMEFQVGSCEQRKMTKQRIDYFGKDTQKTRVGYRHFSSTPASFKSEAATVSN